MATSTATASSGPDAPLGSNNPYKAQIATSTGHQTSALPSTKAQLHSQDSKRQVVPIDDLTMKSSNPNSPVRSLDSEKQVVLSDDLTAGSGNLNTPLRTQDSEKQVVPIDDFSSTRVHTQTGSQDSEKQVLASEEYASDLPMVVEKETLLLPKSEPTREADKEVTSSWQTKSQEESAPIPLEQDQSQTFQRGLLNDLKGEPPSYDSLNQQRTNRGDGSPTTPIPIEPDGSDANLPPRPEDRSAVGKLLGWIPPPPSKPVSQMSPLLQPVVIPQLDLPPRAESVPFQRCYSDALLAHGVPMREFASFLDGLALAQAPNSALQGLKMFGAGVAAIPLPIIPLAGRGLSALATSGSGHSGSRARLYLERAKIEYFAPRRLHLSIIKDPEISQRLQVPAHAYRLAPLTNSTLTENLSRRRLEGLAPYVAPLRYDMPEQDKQIQGVHRMARKHLEGKFKDHSRRLNQMREAQWHNITHNSMESRGWDEKYKSKMASIRSLQLDMIREQQSSSGTSSTIREMMQALDQLQKELQLLISERQMAMQNACGGNRGVEAEMEEINMSGRLKWIVIENLQ